jgi:hypothetical protein
MTRPRGHEYSHELNAVKGGWPVAEMSRMNCHWILYVPCGSGLAIGPRGDSRECDERSGAVGVPDPQDVDRGERSHELLSTDNLTVVVDESTDVPRFVKHPGGCGARRRHVEVVPAVRLDRSTPCS